MTLLHDLEIDIQLVPALLRTIGTAEVCFGLFMLALWRTRWPLWATLGIMVGALVSVAQHSPNLLHAAFNPVSLNGLVFVLAAIALFSQPPPKTKKQPTD
jgi:hypothetical protein